MPIERRDPTSQIRSVLIAVVSLVFIVTLGYAVFRAATGQQSSVATGANDALADVAKGVADGKRAVVSGYTDASGDPAKNAELAKDRAKAVRAALQADGVDAARVGLRKPESTTADGKPEEARRVEIRLVN